MSIETIVQKFHPHYNEVTDDSVAADFKALVKTYPSPQQFVDAMHVTPTPLKIITKVGHNLAEVPNTLTLPEMKWIYDLGIIGIKMIEELMPNHPDYAPGSNGAKLYSHLCAHTSQLAVEIDKKSGVNNAPLLRTAYLLGCIAAELSKNEAADYYHTHLEVRVEIAGRLVEAVRSEPEKKTWWYIQEHHALDLHTLIEENIDRLHHFAIIQMSLGIAAHTIAEAASYKPHDWFMKAQRYLQKASESQHLQDDYYRGIAFSHLANVEEMLAAYDLDKRGDLLALSVEHGIEAYHLLKGKADKYAAMAVVTAGRIALGLSEETRSEATRDTALWCYRKFIQWFEKTPDIELGGLYNKVKFLERSMSSSRKGTLRNKRRQRR